jgi:hypothetical protein
VLSVSAEEILGMPLDSLGAPVSVIEDRSYVELLSDGVSCVSTDNRTVTAVQVHNAGHEGYSGYAGALPAKLQLWMGRPQVRALLGEPLKSGETSQVFVLGKMPPWDSFVVARLKVHVQYNFECNAIRMITLTEGRPIEPSQ